MGNNLFTGIYSGLTNTYSALMNDKTSTGKGLTLDDLSNISSETLSNLGYNQTFIQYLTNNFQNVDKDGDGQISGKDMNNLMSTMQSKGLTYNELQSLCLTGNADSSLLSTVLSYFNKIDSNGDGRVTSEEITKFSMDAKMYEVEQKYKSFKASSASLYYSDGVEDDTSSVLDSLQPDLGNSSTNS